MLFEILTLRFSFLFSLLGFIHSIKCIFLKSHILLLVYEVHPSLGDSFHEFGSSTTINLKDIYQFSTFMN